MRIALLHDFAAEAGGAEAHVSWLGPNLAARGHETLLVDLAERWALPRAGSGTALADKVRAFAPDIVHAHGMRHADAGLIRALARGGLPIVRTLHDYGIVCPAGLLFTRGQPCDRCLTGGIHYSGLRGCINVIEAASRAVAARRERARPSPAIARFLAPSEAQAATLRRVRPFMRIDTIGGFVPDDCFAEPVAAPGRTVAFAGRLVDGKGLDTLMEASKGLRADVLIIGSGPLLGSISVRVKSGGMTHVHVLGRLEGAAYLAGLRRAAVVVVPSTAVEVYPTVACEAFASGMAVVASAVGGLIELVGHDERGWLVTPGDAEALRRAILTLLDDEERRRAMGAAAYAFARQRLTASGYVERLTDVYADVSAGAGRSPSHA